MQIPTLSQSAAPDIAVRSGISQGTVKDASVFKEILMMRLQELSNQWVTQEAATTRHVQHAPSQFRNIFELQSKANDMHLTVQLVSRLGDTAAQAIRRLQQAQG